MFNCAAILFWFILKSSGEVISKVVLVLDCVIAAKQRILTVKAEMIAITVRDIAFSSFCA